MLVNACFEKAFGKEFLKNIKEEEEREVKAHKYNFKLDDQKGSLSINLKNKIDQLEDDLESGKYYEGEKQKDDG